jgi:hypothetical protein
MREIVELSVSLLEDYKILMEIPTRERDIVKQHSLERQISICALAQYTDEDDAS